ncbi:hypothetical protein [Stenotrophomonas sp.]|uniref:hypothetical protein n=1 Tax=Stenotrophomonas sp. TaxID=69392 RepID=UPI0028A69210|nr:hypothetical protein [Stenotrophomonas sp.]
MHSAVRTTFAGLLLSFAGTALADTGTLFVQVERLQSDVPLSKTVMEDVRVGGVTWGVQGKQLVLVQADPRYVDYDYGFTTRFGHSHSVQLPAGEYQLTVVGLEPRQSYSTDKQMNRAAFVTQNIRTVRVESGKTTQLHIEPLILDEDAVRPFVPTLLTLLTDPDVSLEQTRKAARPTAISLRDQNSIAWPDYHGPLKFIPR